MAVKNIMPNAAVILNFMNQNADTPTATLTWLGAITGGTKAQITQRSSNPAHHIKRRHGRAHRLNSAVVMMHNRISQVALLLMAIMLVKNVRSMSERGSSFPPPCTDTPSD